MKVKDRKFRMNYGTYSRFIDVIITEDRKKAATFVNNSQDRQLKLNEDDFDCLGKVCLKSKYNDILWLPRLPKTTEELGTVNHEIFHLVYWRLSCAGLQLSESSEEAFNYLISYLTTQFYKKCKFKSIRYDT